MKGIVIRVCGHCERVYLIDRPCPKCGFGSYDAPWVYGGRFRAICKLLTQTGYRLQQAYNDMQYDEFIDTRDEILEFLNAIKKEIKL